MFNFSAAELLEQHYEMVVLDISAERMVRFNVDAATGVDGEVEGFGACWQLVFAVTLDMTAVSSVVVAAHQL